MRNGAICSATPAFCKSSISLWTCFFMNPIRAGAFVILHPMILAFCAYSLCHFASTTIHPHARVHSGRQAFRRKTAATILSILLFPPPTHLHTPPVRTPTPLFSNSLPNLLTGLSFMPYTIHSLYSHGLIRRLGRLLSDLAFIRDGFCCRCRRSLGRTE